jgi:hypothetical protein
MSNLTYHYGTHNDSTLYSLFGWDYQIQFLTLSPSVLIHYPTLTPTMSGTIPYNNDSFSSLLSPELGAFNRLSFLLYFGFRPSWPSNTFMPRFVTLHLCSLVLNARRSTLLEDWSCYGHGIALQSLAFHEKERNGPTGPLAMTNSSSLSNLDDKFHLKPISLYMFADNASL